MSAKDHAAVIQLFEELAPREEHSHDSPAPTLH